MNGNVLVRDVEYPLTLESEIKFTERDVNVYKLKVARAKGGKHSASTSTETHKKLRQETERYVEKKTDMSICVCVFT